MPRRESEGAVCWDEIFAQAGCTGFSPEDTSSSLNAQQAEQSSTSQVADKPVPSATTKQTTAGAVCWDEIFAQAGCLVYSPELDDPLEDQDHVLDWMLSFQRKALLPNKDSLESMTSRTAGPSRINPAAPVPPPPQPKPGPSRQKPPSITNRIRAKARRAKRKQQKAEYRRRLFLSQLVEDTRQARQSNPLCAAQPIGRKRRNSVHSCSSKCWMDEHVARQAPIRFPECAGLDLDSFVEVVFDTDAQSTEVTAPSEVSDEDLARVTRREIELRRAFMGADVVVPEGVYRWMVARDFAERFPHKVRHVRDNPWPGLEKVWGEPSSRGPSQPGVLAEPEPIRWQSGPRSRFIIRRKAQRMTASYANRMRASTMPGVAFESTTMLSQQASSSATFAVRWLPPTTGTSYTTTLNEQASSSTVSAVQQITRAISSTMMPNQQASSSTISAVQQVPRAVTGISSTMMLNQQASGGSSSAVQQIPATATGTSSTMMPYEHASRSTAPTAQQIPVIAVGSSSTMMPYEHAPSSTAPSAQQIPRVTIGSSATILPNEYAATDRVAPVPLLPVATSESTANPQTAPFPPVLYDTTGFWQ